MPAELVGHQRCRLPGKYQPTRRMAGRRRRRSARRSNRPVCRAAAPVPGEVIRQEGRFPAVRQPGSDWLRAAASASLSTARLRAGKPPAARRLNSQPESQCPAGSDTSRIIAGVCQQLYQGIHLAVCKIAISEVERLDGVVKWGIKPSVLFTGEELRSHPFTQLLLKLRVAAIAQGLGKTHHGSRVQVKGLGQLVSCHQGSLQVRIEQKISQAGCSCGKSPAAVGECAPGKNMSYGQ